MWGKVYRILCKDVRNAALGNIYKRMPCERRFWSWMYFPNVCSVRLFDCRLSLYTIVGIFISRSFFLRIYSLPSHLEDCNLNILLNSVQLGFPRATTWPVSAWLLSDSGTGTSPGTFYWCVHTAQYMGGGHFAAILTVPLHHQPCYTNRPT